MSAAEREAGADLARRAAEQQGLPSVVEDVVTLRRIAVLAGLKRPCKGADFFERDLDGAA